MQNFWLIYPNLHFIYFLKNISYTSLSSSEILYSKGIQESEVFVKLLTQHLIQYSLKSGELLSE